MILNIIITVQRNTPNINRCLLFKKNVIQGYYVGYGAMFQDGLLFLINLAWESRLRLPILLTCVFMALNVRMQLEINIYTQNNGRNRLIEVIQEAVETADSESETSESDSWQTTDEWESQSHTSEDLEVGV